jgi:excinuclease ABC subunit A
VLQRLVDTGNTVLVIEHNLDVIKQADWVIDLGPEGATPAAEVLAVGTPEEVAEVPESYTGRFLRPLLGLEGGEGAATARRTRGKATPARRAAELASA